MKKIQVLFAASEAFPLAKVGGLGDVIGSLPRALEKIGLHVGIAMPLYRHLIPQIKKFKRIETNVAMPNWEGKSAAFSVYETRLPRSKVPIFLFHQPDILGNEGIYLAKNSSLPEQEREGRRFAFFSGIVSAALQKDVLPFYPDIVHTHDMQTSLLTEKIKEIKVKRRIKTVLTIHNLGSQGLYRGQNLLGAGLRSANIITTVSPTYAKEITRKEMGMGFDAILRRRGVRGILNGFDYNALSVPIPKDKAAYKKKFQKKHGLRQNTTAPLFAFVARLTDQKGVSLFLPLISRLIKSHGAQFAIVGTGDKKLEIELGKLAKHYPREVFTHLEFSEAIAQETYAAADFFLMPSRFEPCGLGQIIAMHYGTIPIVRDVGGLHDTVRQNKTGFLFKDFSPSALNKAISSALKVFSDETKFMRMRANASRENFSWAASAKQYKAVYERLLKD